MSLMMATAGDANKWKTDQNSQQNGTKLGNSGFF